LTIWQHTMTPGPGGVPHTIGVDLTPTGTYLGTSNIQACNLNSITNEYGGKTALSYIAAQSYSVSGTFENVAGVLLKTIDKYDGYSSQNDMRTIFEYSDGEKFETHERPFIYLFTTTTNTSGGYVDQMYEMFSNYGNVLNQSLNGINFGFKTVEEKITNKSTATLISKNVYKFSGGSGNTYVPDFVNSDADFNRQFVQAPFTNKQYLRSWGIGLLTEKFEYDGGNNPTCSTGYAYSVTSHYESSNFKGTHSMVTKY